MPPIRPDTASGHPPPQYPFDGVSNAAADHR